MQAVSVQQIIRDRRAGPAMRFLASTAAANLAAQERLSLEAVALPLLSEEEIEKKWLDWLASPSVPFSLLVQQLAKRLVSLPDESKTVFAEKLHKLLQEALKQGRVQPGPKEKLEEHQIIFDLLAPHVPLLAAPKAAEELPPPAIVPAKPLASETEQAKPLKPAQRIIIRRPKDVRTAPPPSRLPVETKPPLEAAELKPIETKPAAARFKPQLESLPDHPPFRMSRAAKPVMDVRPPAMLGPIDELKTIGLEDFRRLGDTAEDRTKKIENMIRAISKEGLNSFRQAVSAWVDSSVMQLQRSIGFASLRGEQALEAEIARRQEVGQPTLSKDEFEALADLAERLQE